MTPPNVVPSYLGYDSDLVPALATDGRMTYLELSSSCISFGYIFIVPHPGTGNIAYVEIILPAPRTVKTILHSSREYCYPYGGG